MRKINNLMFPLKSANGVYMAEKERKGSERLKTSLLFFNFTDSGLFFFQRGNLCGFFSFVVTNDNGIFL